VPDGTLVGCGLFSLQGETGAESLEAMGLQAYDRALQKGAATVAPGHFERSKPANCPSSAFLFPPLHERLNGTQHRNADQRDRHLPRATAQTHHRSGNHCSGRQ
jgi:hypothetical protein